VPLIVLIYEGIVAGVLDFDYAPQSVLISQDGTSKRSFMNVTQVFFSPIHKVYEPLLSLQVLAGPRALSLVIHQSMRLKYELKWLFWTQEGKSCCGTEAGSYLRLIHSCRI